MVRMINFLRLMQLLRRVVLIVGPWIGQIIWFMTGFVLTAIISFWGGVPRTTDRIANEWLDRAVHSGFPTEWDRKLYYAFYFLALSMIVAGWVILSFTTVWFVNLIF